MSVLDFLIDEHKLIGKMVSTLRKKMEIKDASLIKRKEVVIDFFKTYADRCHHGKEEVLFFQKLMQKPMSEEHKKILRELLQEHKEARELVIEFDKTESFEVLDKLLTLYVKHMEKENNHFFVPALNYLTTDEQIMMEVEFEEFDQQMIHLKYATLVASFS